MGKIYLGPLRWIWPIPVAIRVVIRDREVAPNSSNGIRTGTNRVQNPRKRPPWTRPPRLRDREAPGSNPGPPTIVWSIRPQHLGIEPCSDPRYWNQSQAQRNTATGFELLLGLRAEE